jgi:thiol:disulfide interchange protein DsbD
VRLLLVRLGLALGLAAPAPAALAAARAEGALDRGEPRVEARLLVHPDGDDAHRVRAGVLLTPDPGWHVYWKNPGDTGLATKLAWRGGEAGPVAWPAPSAFDEDGLVTYGYAEPVLLASELRLAPGADRIGVDVDVLLCRESCIPARLSLEHSLVESPTLAERTAVQRLFALHDAALPRSAEQLGIRLDASRPDPARPARLRLTAFACDDAAPGAACASLSLPESGHAFFPADGGLRLVEASPSRGKLSFLLEHEAEAGDALGGVLALVGGDGRLHHVEVALATPAPAAPAGAAAGSVLAMLGLALLGGLLLNLMPCVLPVLALKAFAVAELAGSRRGEALAHGLAYTVGILASMLALAAVVLALRLAGHEVGWGFQFQSPVFLVVVSAVCVVFALNLFGLFEIGFVPGQLASVGAESVGARRSFFEGLLAVALATPCSAPFLGTAVGFAFATSGLFVVTIFLAIGLGLAAPFLAISVFPPAARWLPRSGGWMGELRIVLGFALLATVVWLVWVMAKSAGPDAAAGLLALLLALALLVRWFGRAESRRRLRAGLLVAGVALVALSPNWIRPQPERLAPVAEGRAAWSPPELARLRAQGRPVLVVFTADWCLTCKVNESGVLASAAVEDALARLGYAVLEADWTRRDEAIRRELLRFGRAAVPLYLVYQPGAAEPQVLPELLSVERVLAALEFGDSDHMQATREADAS